MADPTPPADDDDAPSGADTTGDTDPDRDATAPGSDTDQDGQVVCTVLCYQDGTYGVVQGDENEQTPGAEGSEGQEPERYSSKGETLKAVLEAINDFDQQNPNGQGANTTADQNFQAGYDQG